MENRLFFVCNHIMNVMVNINKGLIVEYFKRIIIQLYCKQDYTQNKKRLHYLKSNVSLKNMTQ